MKNLSKLFLLLLLFLLAGPAVAALPPLDDSQRHRDSSQVVQGEILAIYSRKDKKKDEYVNRELILEIRLTGVEKGSLQTGSVVYARCWTIETRPQRWVGDGGQRPLPRTGDSGTFYLTTSPAGVHTLLHPNGWDRD